MTTLYVGRHTHTYRRMLFKCVVKCLRFRGKREIANLNFAFARGLKPRPSHLGVKMSGQSTVTTPCLNLESVVRGHHVYKRVWRPATGEQLKLIREECNEHDPRTVAIMKDERVVGHIPQYIAKTVWFFLRRGGSGMCEITGRRKKGNGLEVPCVYSLSGPDKLVRKLESVLDERQRSLP